MTRIRKGVVLAATLIAAFSARASAQVATPSLIGKWGGVADVVVDWTKQRTIPINIVIRADDQVTGTIGDATLVRARLRRNRGWLARTLQTKTDFIIEAELEGQIIGTEQLQRDVIQIPFNWRDGRLVGSVNSSRNTIGPATQRTFVAKFTLIRMPDLMICETR